MSVRELPGVPPLWLVSGEADGLQIDLTFYTTAAMMAFMRKCSSTCLIFSYLGA